MRQRLTVAVAVSPTIAEAMNVARTMTARLGGLQACSVVSIAWVFALLSTSPLWPDIACHPLQETASPVASDWCQTVASEKLATETAREAGLVLCSYHNYVGESVGLATTCFGWTGSYSLVLG